MVAFVKELAGVGRHLGWLCRAALWACQRRRGNNTHLVSRPSRLVTPLIGLLLD